MGVLGLTRDQLADRAGIDRKTVYNLLSGDRWPQPKTRNALERVLGWYPGDLLRLGEGGEPVLYDMPPTGRELLADFTTKRMNQLKLDWEDVARDGEMTAEDVDQIRRMWDPDERQRRSLERALHWKPGSIDGVLADGREPATLEAWRAERKRGNEDLAERLDERLRWFEEDNARRQRESDERIQRLEDEVKRLKEQRSG